MAPIQEDAIAAKEITTNKLDVKSALVLNGTLEATDVEANASANVFVTNIGPAGIGTSTIAKWLKVTQGGVIYYIPMWT